MREPLLILLLALASMACKPSRAAMTAGEIGCPEREISTYHDSSSGGFTQSARSWIAECRGRRFVCSEVRTSSSDITWLFTDGTDSVDSDVSCREELSTTPPPAREGALSFEIAWQWSSTERLRLLLRKPPERASAAALELVYVRETPKLTVDVRGL